MKFYWAATKELGMIKYKSCTGTATVNENILTICIHFAPRLDAHSDNRSSNYTNWLMDYEFFYCSSVWNLFADFGFSQNRHRTISLINIIHRYAYTREKNKSASFSFKYYNISDYDYLHFSSVNRFNVTNGHLMLSHERVNFSPGIVATISIHDFVCVV